MTKAQQIIHYREYYNNKENIINAIMITIMYVELYVILIISIIYIDIREIFVSDKSTINHELVIILKKSITIYQ